MSPPGANSITMARWCSVRNTSLNWMTLRRARSQCQCWVLCRGMRNHTVAWCSAVPLSTAAWHRGRTVAAGKMALSPELTRQHVSVTQEVSRKTSGPNITHWCKRRAHMAKVAVADDLALDVLCYLAGALEPQATLSTAVPKRAAVNRSCTNNLAGLVGSYTECLAPTT